MRFTSPLIVFVVIALFLTGCAPRAPSAANESNTPPPSTVQAKGIEELALTASDVDRLALTANETPCALETYTADPSDSPLRQYGLCEYGTRDGSTITIQLYRYAAGYDINGSYQYSSGHLQGAKGIISRDTFGDQSRFSHNSEDDYGAEFNPPGVFFYHLWFTRGTFMVHVTSKGSNETGAVVEAIGRVIEAKIG